VPTTGYVAVASTRLLSLEQASLPLGYGFAIVTRDGRSLYHSDSRLGLRENLFDHLDAQGVARAIVQSRTKAGLSRATARFRITCSSIHCRGRWTTIAATRRMRRAGGRAMRRPA
jgi:hypothetical protein